MKYEIVWLNSGGPDSLVAILKTIEDWGRENCHVVSLYVDFNPHNRERAMAAAEENARLAEADEHVVLPLNPGQDFWFWNSRNYFTHPYLAVWITVAAMSYALHREFRHVVTGMRGDIGREYVRTLVNLFTQKNPGQEPDRAPVLWNPLYDLPPTVEETASIARDFEVSLAHTWSCNRYPGCGTCRKCLGREWLGLPKD